MFSNIHIHTKHKYRDVYNFQISKKSNSSADSYLSLPQTPNFIKFPQKQKYNTAYGCLLCYHRKPIDPIKFGGAWRIQNYSTFFLWESFIIETLLRISFFPLVPRIMPKCEWLTVTKYLPKAAMGYIYFLDCYLHPIPSWWYLSLMTPKLLGFFMATSDP